MPDVCRTFHFASGVHIAEQQQKKYFDTHSFNKNTKLYQLQTKKYASDSSGSLYTTVVATCMPYPVYHCLYGSGNNSNGIITSTKIDRISRLFLIKYIIINPKMFHI